MDVLQCPECTLRFRFASELEWHLKLDHPEFQARTPLGEARVDEVHRQQRRHRQHEPRQR